MLVYSKKTNKASGAKNRVRDKEKDCWGWRYYQETWSLSLINTRSYLPNITGVTKITSLVKWVVVKTCELSQNTIEILHWSSHK